MIITTILIFLLFITVSWALSERAQKRKLERDSVEKNLDGDNFMYEDLYRFHLEYKGAGGNPKKLFEKKEVLQKLKRQILQTSTLEALCGIFHGYDSSEKPFSLFAKTIHSELIADEAVRQKIVAIAKSEQDIQTYPSEQGEEFLSNLRKPFFHCDYVDGEFDLMGFLLLPLPQKEA